MVALWIHGGTLLAGDGALGVRLLGPILAAVATLLLADAAECLLPGRRAGVRAALLLNATLLFGVGTIIMTPDTPLLVFWTACLWAMARLLRQGDPRWWLAVGLFAGLAMASKYTAALLWFGIVLWLLLTPSMRFWLRRWAPWLGAALAVAVFLPNLLWNASHDWTSLLRQGGRVGDWQPLNAPRFLAELIAGQFGLATPLVFLFCAGGIAIAARNAWRTRDPAWTLLASMTLPAVALFTQHAIGDRVQGGWPAIIYPAAAIAAADLRSAPWRRLLPAAVALGFGITLLAYVEATTSAFSLPVPVDPIALRLKGWDALAADVDAVRRQESANFVAADEYGLAAQLAHTLPPGVPVIGVEPRWRLFHLPRAEFAGQTGLLVQSTRDAENISGALWTNAKPVGAFERAGGVETYRLFRVTMLANSPQAVLMPNRDR
jgi:4-amino-4-deoxy-L-arabinose transferase-like glycosyltransferase